MVLLTDILKILHLQGTSERVLSGSGEVDFEATLRKWNHIHAPQIEYKSEVGLLILSFSYALNLSLFSVKVNRH